MNSFSHQQWKSNSMLDRVADALQRFRWVVIALVALSTPLVFRAAAGALGERDNQVRQWLPHGFEETQRYDWFLQHFDSEEFTLVSWQGASVADERLAELAAALRRYTTDPDSAGDNETIARTKDKPAWFREILTGPELLAQLQREPLQLTQQQAARRLRGSLFGPDGKTTGLLVMVGPQGQAQRHAAVQAITAEADRVGISADQLRLGGPTIDSVALDQESERSRYWLTALALSLGSLAAWRCLKQLRLVAIVLLTAIYCGAATLAWVHVFGDKLNLVMVTMPTLVYVLTISGAIHITHYFHAAVLQHGRETAIRHALAAGWLPCALSAATTAIGLGSLMVSHVEPVRLFGFYSTLGVLTSLPVVLLFLPAMLSIGAGREKQTSAADLALRPTPAHGLSLTNRLASAVGSGVIRWHAPIAVAGVGLMLFSLVGLARLTTSVKLTDFFSPESRVIADYRWLEQNLGALVPVEVVLRMPRDEDAKMLDRVILAGRVQHALASLPHVDGAISAATFAPPVPGGGGVRQVTRRTLINSHLERNRPQLMAAGYLAHEGDYELWRISARVAALNDVDYGRFIDRMQAAVQPVLDQHAQARQADTDVPPVQAVYTGVVPLVYKAQRVLLEDLTSSFMLAFGIIAIVMLVLMQGLGAGLVSMLPNMFPAVIVFGVMGWTRQQCDIGSMITASVALGIAVDDTIHFLSWFRRGLAGGMTRQAAILEAYRRCGPAMLQTTLVCGLGMLGFAFSSFAPTARFATLMVTLLGTALVGDLLLLPALLAGPLGRYFERRPVASLEPATSFDGKLVPGSA